MKLADFQKERGLFIQHTGNQPDHCRIHPKDADELLKTAGKDGRLAKGGKFAVIIGIPTLLDESVPAGQALFETRERMPYEALPAHQKPKQPQ